MIDGAGRNKTRIINRVGTLYEKTTITALLALITFFSVNASGYYYGAPCKPLSRPSPHTETLTSIPIHPSHTYVTISINSNPDNSIEPILRKTLIIHVVDEILARARDKISGCLCARV